MRLLGGSAHDAKCRLSGTRHVAHAALSMTFNAYSHGPAKEFAEAYFILGLLATHAPVQRLLDHVNAARPD